METALEGIRILDLTRFLAGPYGSMVLADLGAEVIKIEAPTSRKEGEDGIYTYNGMEAFFMSTNRNKKSIALDLSVPEARQVFYDLVKVSDVVYDNFRPGVAERLGVDYETLRELNPGIICSSISGFGSTGPYAQRPAYDLIVQALTGAVAITGNGEGPPVRNGVAISDQGAGLLAAIGVLAALLKRERTGFGQKLETSLLEATVHQLAYEATIYLACGIEQEHVGSGHLVATPYGIYPTADGWVAVVASGRFDAFAIAIDRPELATDERFTSRKNLWKHKDELEAIITPVFKERTTAEWLRRLEEMDIPCSPINSLPEGLEDPQVKARDMVVDVDHVSGGKVKLIGNPIKMSGTPDEVRRKYESPPLLGQHGKDLLKDLLEYPDAKIEELRQVLPAMNFRD